MLAALKERDEATDRISRRSDEIAIQNFGLEPSTPAPAVAEGKTPDLAGMSAWLLAQARRVRGKTGRDDPFALADGVLLRSMTPGGKSVALAAMVELAREIVEVIPLVPPGAVHDSDRATLLGLAAGLVARAVAAETGIRPINEGYNEKAAYAVALLDQAVALQPDDPAGRLQEARAIALAQADRVPEGLAQARELVAREPRSAAHTMCSRTWNPRAGTPTRASTTLKRPS